MRDSPDRYNFPLTKLSCPVCSRFVRFPKSPPRKPAMNIPQAIDLNKTALARIVAGLFALLGAAGEAALARIPLELHRAVARVLRPAESAARRLIVTLARIANLKAPPPQSRPAPAGLARAAQGNFRLSFQLFDPRRRFFRPRDQAQRLPRPRISFFGAGEAHRVSLGREKPPKHDKSDGLETSANLLRRLKALKEALDDLPRQARRLVRALARRQNVPRLKLKMPLRPGRAPGLRQKPRLDIDHVLHQCDWLARNALAPDTS